MTLDIFKNIHYNIQANGVWRSLVSRLVRVQEASGSNPDTPTTKSQSDVLSDWLFTTFNKSYPEFA